MKGPTEQTIRKLLALSGNQCAFHDCITPIVEPSGTITGRICHIKAKSPGGPRFDPNQDDEERNGYHNLILLCSRHHTIVDDQPNVYTAERLREIKEMQERNGSAQITEESARLARLLLQSYVDGLEGVPVTQIVTGEGNVTAGRDLYINRHVIQKNIIQPGPEHVTEEQKVKIRDLIKELSAMGETAGRRASYGKWFNKFYKEFKVTSYHLLPASQYEAAIEWLYQQRARERP